MALVYDLLVLHTVFLHFYKGTGPWNSFQRYTGIGSSTAGRSLHPECIIGVKWTPKKFTKCLAGAWMFYWKSNASKILILIAKPGMIMYWFNSY